MKPTYTGRLSISASRHNVSIEFVEGISGLYAFTAEVDAREFLAAIARSGNVPCAFWMNESGRVGATREVKTEMVPFDFSSQKKQAVDTDVYSYRTPATVEALAPFETDGWSANERDMWNGHNRETVNGAAYQRVTFIRFVRGGVPV